LKEYSTTNFSPFSVEINGEPIEMTKIPEPPKSELKRLYLVEGKQISELIQYFKGTKHEASRPTIEKWITSYNLHQKKKVFTATEIELIKKLYLTASKSEILKALPNWSWRAIGSKASKLRIIGRPTGRTGKKNANWNGGRRKSSNGYVLVYMPNHPKANTTNCVPEHILVWEKTHGKPVPSGYVIHHLNGLRDDNRPENLVAVPRPQHERHTLVKLAQKRIRELEEQIRNLK